MFGWLMIASFLLLIYCPEPGMDFAFSAIMEIGSNSIIFKVSFTEYAVVSPLSIRPKLTFNGFDDDIALPEEVISKKEKTKIKKRIALGFNLIKGKGTVRIA